MRSTDSRGRVREEEPCPLRTCFQRDRDRVGAQQGLPPFEAEDPGLSQARRGITTVPADPHAGGGPDRPHHCRALRLNEDLTEAIALAHDLGHTPFGHAGERALNRLAPHGFTHYRQSLRVVDRLEKGGKGLNLTWEVRNGILCHTKGTWPATLEGQVVATPTGSPM